MSVEVIIGGVVFVAFVAAIFLFGRKKSSSSSGSGTGGAGTGGGGKREVNDINEN